MMHNQLFKPIFLVGHARAGSTFLGSIIANHPDVGPKYLRDKLPDDPNMIIDLISQQDQHYPIATLMEQKEVWFDYFPGKNSFTTMGKDCICEDVKHLSDFEIDELVQRLTQNFHQNRFFSKAPTNSFRIKAIKKLFPSSKIVILYRNPYEVVSSYLVWTVRPTYRQMGYVKAIRELGKKWQETVDYLETARSGHEFVITYDDIIEDFIPTIKKLFEYLELSVPDYIYRISPTDNRAKWKTALPWNVRLVMITHLRRLAQSYACIEGHRIENLKGR